MIRFFIFWQMQFWKVNTPGQNLLHNMEQMARQQGARQMADKCRITKDIS